MCFLAGTPSTAFTRIPIPFSQGDTLDAVLKATFEGVTALVQGMQEMRASAVTRQTLTELYKLQLQEMQIYVQAETAPLHRSVKNVMDSMQQLELRVASGNPAARPEPHDPARRRIAFIGFGSATTVDERIAAMDRFMKEHFHGFQIRCYQAVPRQKRQAIGEWFRRDVCISANSHSP